MGTSAQSHGPLISFILVRPVPERCAGTSATFSSWERVRPAGWRRASLIPEPSAADLHQWQCGEGGLARLVDQRLLITLMFNYRCAAFLQAIGRTQRAGSSPSLGSLSFLFKKDAACNMQLQEGCHCMFCKRSFFGLLQRSRLKWNFTPMCLFFCSSSWGILKTDSQVRRIPPCCHLLYLCHRVGCLFRVLAASSPI